MSLKRRRQMVTHSYNEHYTALKTNELQSHASAWMHVTNTELKEKVFWCRDEKQANLNVVGGQAGKTGRNTGVSKALVTFYFHAMWWPCERPHLTQTFPKVCMYAIFPIYSFSPSTIIFPLGPLILSKEIYLLRALSTYCHLFPWSQVKLLSRRCKTKREINLFIPQSKIYSRKISVSIPHS